jgi:hypothetical protein
MQIVFTLCSVNYLAQAKALGDSVLRHNPDYKFIVGLIDKNHTGVDLSFMGGHELLEVEKVILDGLEDMAARYNIVELVTATKPFYFDYLFKHHPDAVAVTYFDPDIKVFAPLTDMAEKLERFNVILTPHFTQPIQDKLLPTEKHVLNTGVFNLGFAAMQRGAEADKLNSWWMGKLRRECIADLAHGYFVDQLWMNLAPAYFDKVLIEKHPGWNTAHWNLHERTLSEVDGHHLVNQQPLIFYHFSHYSPKRPEAIASFHTRFSFASRPDLVPLYRQYNDELIANRYLELIDIRCFYVNHQRQKELKRKAMSWIRQNVPQGVKMKLGKLLKRS